MPFTFAHPAAVLPLPRRKLVFSALAVGSMAPDFEYFFGLTHPASHTMPGLVTFTFPVAIAALVIFHELLKWPLISLLPRAMQARMIGPARRFRWLPASRLLLILLSLAIGIGTHVLVDGCTHPDGWAVTRWPAMAHVVAVPWRHSIPVWKLLQYEGTALGTLILVASFVLWYRRAACEDRVLRPQFTPVLRWGIVSGMVLLAVVFGLSNGADWYGAFFHGASHRVRFVMGSAMMTAMVGMIEIFGYGVVWRALFSGGTLESVVENRRRR